MPNRRYPFCRSSLIFLCLLFVFSTSCRTNGNDAEDRLAGIFSLDQLRLILRRCGKPWKAIIPTGSAMRARQRSAAFLTRLTIPCKMT